MPQRTLPLLALAALIALLTGCGDSSPPTKAPQAKPEQSAGLGASGSPTSTTQPASDTSGNTSGGELIFVSVDEHNLLDPQKMSWLHDIRIGECLFEPLLRVKVPELTIEPGVAKSWQLGDDGRTLTFNLRDDARWSNGDPVTAHDFVYAWRRALLPDFAADYSQLFFRIEGAEVFFRFRAEQLKRYAESRSTGGAAGPADLWREVEERFDKFVGIKVVDNHTLTVRLAKPTPYFLELVAFISFAPNHAASMKPLMGFNPETAMQTIDSRYWSSPDKLVSNGAYVLKRRRFKQDLSLAQNPHYWNRAAMRNTAITEKIMDTQAAMLAYRNGQVNWLPDVPTASTLAADLANANRPDVKLTPWAGTYFYNFNCTTRLQDGSANPLADPRVRRALALGIDRKMLVEQVTRMNQPAARTFIPPGVLPGYDSPVDAGAAYNIDEARDLLKQAGYSKDKPLTGLSILYNTGAGHENIAQAIKRTWDEQLGVVVTLEGVEGKTFSTRLKKQEYTIARASWIGDYRDATTFLDKFITDNGNNDAAWSSPKYDTLMRRAADEADAAARLGLLREAEAMMLRDQPIAPIYHYITMNVYDPTKIEGVHPNAWNFRRMEMVYVRP